MDLLRLLNATGAQGPILKSIAGQFGLEEKEADMVVKGIMGALSGGVQNQVKQGGAQDIIDLTKSQKTPDYAEQTKVITEARDNGNNILGQLLGSKDASREVASNVSQQSGVNSELIKLMLPLVASMAMSSLRKVTDQEGGSDALAAMITPILDQDGDGQALDDVIDMLVKIKAQG